MADAQTRAWLPGDRAWLDGAMWRRTVQPGRPWRSDHWDSRSRTDAEMSAAGAVLVATADGPVQQVGAIRPQVLTEDTPEPARPWVIVPLDAPLDPWGSDMWAASWVEVVAGCDGPVYVIGGDRG